MSQQYTTQSQLETLFRPLKESEVERALALIPIVEDSLRQEAKIRNRDIDQMIADGDLLESVFVSVVCDVVGRALNTSTDEEPITQFSQSGLGYTVSGSYLVPGGGVWIKKSELSRLGLRRQRYGVIDFYGTT